MAESIETMGQRDRSPSYPLIPLETALERLVAFEEHFKRSPARPERVGDAWGIKAKAYADRTLASLRYFGLVNYTGTGAARQVVISDEGRKYLRAQQEETKREILRAAATRPKQIAKFWKMWGLDRPSDAACLDGLVFSHSFSEAGAKEFLKVYDATIAFAGLTDSDKLIEDESEEEGSAPDDERLSSLGENERREDFTVKEGERVLSNGILSKSAKYRVIVSGSVGAKEIDRLIHKLEMDREILSEADENDLGVEESTAE